MKARMREKTSSCLTQQHRPYFILCAVNQLEASEHRQEEREPEREGERGERRRKRKQAREKERWRAGGATQSNRPGINSERNRC